MCDLICIVEVLDIIIYDFVDNWFMIRVVCNIEVIYQGVFLCCVLVISWVQVGVWLEVIDIFELGDVDQWDWIFKGILEQVFWFNVVGDFMIVFNGWSILEGY